MKRLLALITVCLLVCACVSGCEKEEAPGLFEAENEIYTYRPADKTKTAITVSVTGNIAIENVSEAFEKANPDVQVVLIDITGGTDYYRPVLQWLENGLAPDVMLSQSRFVSDEYAVKYFENLSDDPVLDEYESGSLSHAAVKGNIYMLPGPSTLFCMHYNKTMFEKYGWTFPKTFDELVALCERITADTNGEVVPFNPNAKYSSEFIATMEALCYEQLFAGLDNRTWYQGVIDGTSRFKGHMEPFYEVGQKLIEAGVLTPEMFNYSATTRGKEFWAGKIAMINFPVATNEGSDFEVGYAPFPGTTGDGYVCNIVDVLMGVTKKERGDKQKDAIGRFVKFMSTVEAQSLLADGRVMFSSIKNAPTLGEGDITGLNDALSSGRMFTRLDFENSAVARDDLRGGLMQMTLGEKTQEECIADIDAMIEKGAAAKPGFPVVAVAERDFTILETSEYIADMYREKAESDIALIADQLVYRGNVMRVFKGEINTETVKVLLPRSFENGSALVKAEMTGDQLLKALNDPVGNGATADCVYAFSGLKCTVAPWMKLGEKYESVALSSGEKIEPDKIYTVAFWEGTVYDKYITNVAKRFEGSFSDFLTEKLERDKTISPAKDGRITLKWNQAP